MDTGRLQVLDGMRGVAALMVVVYHLGARWSTQVQGQSLYPHGDIVVSTLPAIRYFGFIGVFLFFLISGFVIMLTLQRCSGLLDFSVRRFSRLWPVMLVCATLTTLLVNGTQAYERFDAIAYWQVKPVEYFASLAFIDPGLISRLFYGGIDLRWADGVYWTLWVEVRFYALIAITYWLFRGRAFLWAWCGIQFLSALGDAIYVVPGLQSMDLIINLVLQPERLAWFTLGVTGYFYWQKQLSLPILIAAGIAMIDIFNGPLAEAIADQTIIPIVIRLAILAPFVIFLLKSPLFSILGHKWAVTMGMASYPLYMFHDRAGMVMLFHFEDWGVNPYLGLALAFTLVVMIAFAISKLVEMPGRSLLMKLTTPLAKRGQAVMPALRFAQEKPST